MKYIISTAALALLSTSVFAADEVYPYQPTPVIAEVPAFTWSGGYIGVNAGYGGGKWKTRTTELDSPYLISATRSSASGFIGGAQAGYNWQAGSFVYGIETDIQYSRLAIAKRLVVENAAFEARVGIDWFGTTRARLGFVPTERFLVYATGGVAYGKMEASGGEAACADDRTRWQRVAGRRWPCDDRIVRQTRCRSCGTQIGDMLS